VHGRVLVVDDDRDMCDLIEADLTSRGFQVLAQQKAEQAFAELRSGDFDVILTDLNMPGMGGIELCERVVANRPDIPVVVITAFGSMESAIAAIRAGAYDFVTKPIEMDVLELTLRRAIDRRRLQEQVKVLSETVRRAERFDELLGASPPMQRLYEQLARVAESDASVLITGESGAGKELVARALHRRSRRSDGPFVAVNCAALPETLLEAELFGHARGAFTDARAARKGLFLQANGGTLLLDEIGEFPLPLQPKLLRALEQRSIRPVGGDSETPADVRILASTNRDLETAVEDGRFRDDLFYRINVIQIQTPALRARGTDVLLLAQHFLEQIAPRANKNVTAISEPAAARLLTYAWPGNVRELRNAIEHAVALTVTDKLVVEDLPERIRNYRSDQLVLGSEDPAELAPMEDVERRYIQHVLRTVGGNKTLAARTLGFDRKTLYRKLERYGMPAEDAAPHDSSDRAGRTRSPRNA
jgi:DNA-binding NtrC family response regulator